MATTPLDSSCEIYQFHILLLQISPAIWRRVFIRNDSSIADLRHVLQIIMGWDDTHLHRFTLHGKEYGIAQPGGIWFRDDPTQIRLTDLHLRLKERFLYEYDLIDNWQHQLRLEQKLPFDPTRTYPFCISGARQAPPDRCGGAAGYLEQKRHFSPVQIASRMLEIVEDEQAKVSDYWEEFVAMRYWLGAATFDRRAVNTRLALYAAGDERWQDEDLEVLP